MKRHSALTLTMLLIMACTWQLQSAAQDRIGRSKLGGLRGSSSEPITVSAFYRLKEGSRIGNLHVTARMGEGYHCYSQNHEGVGVPSSIDVAKSDQYKIVGGFVPDVPPHIYEKDAQQWEEFEHEVTWLAPIELAEGVDPAALQIAVTYTGMVCNESGCLPPNSEELVAGFDGYRTDMEVAVADSSPAPENKVEETGTQHRPDTLEPTKSDNVADLTALYNAESKINYVKLDGSTGVGTFWAALLGAYVGGMLLNLMPCVFPVLGLKVLGFVEQAGNDRHKLRMHGFAFTLGLLVCMWVLAGAILAIKHVWGQDVNWGQQMGNPYFVGGVVILLFVLGLNLTGVFEMGLFMTRVGGASERKEGYAGSFVGGGITTLVATPCSGPFLGAAMGYTLAQPAMIAMFLFTIFGLGIATPYLILSIVPSLIRLLPRPGAWMETFKTLMAFTLFAAAAFFVKSFGSQTGVDGLSWFLMALCVIALATYFYGKWSPAYVKPSQRYVWGWIVPALIAGLGVWMYLDAAKLKAPEVVVAESGWELWKPGSVEKILAANKPVWVDYTADW